MNTKISAGFGILLGIIVITIGISALILVRGETLDTDFNEEDCIKFSEYSAIAVIPQNTELIGTYLIDINSMNSKIFKAAKESAKNSGQLGIFYKSELGNGAWYDITNAVSISAIEPTGNAVFEDDLADLYLRYYVDAEGVIHDLKKGKVIAPYTGDEFYDLTTKPEFSDLYAMSKTYAEASREDETHDYYSEVLYEYIFLPYGKEDRHLDLHNYNWTADVGYCRNEFDAVIDNMTADREKLLSTKSEQDEELADILKDFIEEVYNEKVYYYYGLVIEKSNSDEIMDYFENPTNHTWKRHANGNCPVTEDDNVLNSLAEALEQFEASRIDAYGNMTLEPDENATELDKRIYSSFVNVKKVSGGELSEVRDALRDYLFYVNLKDDNVEFRTHELEQADKVLPVVSDAFKNSVKAGKNSHYDTLLLQEASEGELIINLESQMKVLDVLRTDELQQIISAIGLRAEDLEYAGLISERIRWTTALYDTVKDDEFKPYADKVITDHIKWLSDILDSLTGIDFSANLNSLENEKNILEAELAAAVADNDAATEKIIIELLEDINKRINDERAKSGLSITDSSSNGNIDGENVDGLSPNSGAISSDLNGDKKKIEELKSVLIEDLKNGAEADFKAGKSESGNLNALKGMNADNAIEDLKTKLSDNKAFNEALKDKPVNDARLIAASGQNAEKTGDDPTERDDKEDIITDVDISSVLYDFEISAEGKIIAAVATGWLGDEGYVACRDISKRLLSECVAENNKYVYETLVSEKTEMVSLRTVSKITRYRYVYESDFNTATMEHDTGVGSAYVYRVGDTAVSIGLSDSDTLSVAPKLTAAGVYVPEDSTALYFDITSEVLSQKVNSTSYSAAFKSDMTEKARELYNNLLSTLKENV